MTFNMGHAGNHAHREPAWEWVKGFNGYYKVSDLGQVKSVHRVFIDRRGIRRVVQERILKPFVRSGRLIVTLRKGSYVNTYPVKHLVARAFLHNPWNYKCVIHKDGNPRNCAAANLEWVPREDTYRASVVVKRELASLSVQDITDIRLMYRKGSQEYGIKGLARLFGLSPQTVKKIVSFEI